VLKNGTSVEQIGPVFNVVMALLWFLWRVEFYFYRKYRVVQNVARCVGWGEMATKYGRKKL
jgi:hypothetical protein